MLSNSDFLNRLTLSKITPIAIELLIVISICRQAKRRCLEAPVAVGMNSTALIC